MLDQVADDRPRTTPRRKSYEENSELTFYVHWEDSQHRKSAWYST